MSKFVSVSGGIFLFQIDTEQEPVIVTPTHTPSEAETEVITGNLSVGKSQCGCISIFQIFTLFGGAIITEASSKNTSAIDFYPFVTEDEEYYFITEQSDMSTPIKVSELSQADVNDIVANLDTAQILLSLDTGAGYVSYNLTFDNLIDIIKTAIKTDKLIVTISGVGGQSNSLIGVNILDAQLNGQNIDILAAVPVSGEQGLYVNTVTGDYELYNMGDDLTGAILKILYSNQ